MESETRRSQKGFTIVELLVVLLIISIVVAITLVSLMNAFDKTKQRATMADMRTTVLTPYHSTVLPTQDHWRATYGYSSNQQNLYTIESYGKGGMDGADITLGSRFDFELDIVLANGVFVAAPE
jgi:prepilin-type N-terminal cleavage/methylation domain-containing protein